MFRGFAKVLVLGATVVAALASASKASATNWTSNGSAPGTAFSATAPATRFEFHVTNPSHLVGVACTGTTATGRLLGPTGPINTGAWNGVATLRPSYSGCVAGSGFVVSCAEQQLDAISQAGSVVTGTIRGIDCTLGMFGCTITMTGNLPVTYNNVDLLTIGTDGVSASWPNSGNCRLAMGTTAGGIASVTWGTAHLSPNPLPYTVTSSFRPRISHN